MWVSQLICISACFFVFSGNMVFKSPILACQNTLAERPGTDAKGIGHGAKQARCHLHEVGGNDRRR